MDFLLGIQTTLKDRSQVHQQMAKPKPNGLTNFCLFVCSRITILYCFICVLIFCLTGLHTDIMISDFMFLFLCFCQVGWAFVYAILVLFLFFLICFFCLFCFIFARLYLLVDFLLLKNKVTFLNIQMLVVMVDIYTGSIC